VTTDRRLIPEALKNIDSLYQSLLAEVYGLEDRVCQVEGERDWLANKIVGMLHACPELDDHSVANTTGGWVREAGLKSHRDLGGMVERGTISGEEAQEMVNARMKEGERKTYELYGQMFHGAGAE